MTKLSDKFVVNVYVAQERYVGKLFKLSDIAS